MREIKRVTLFFGGAFSLALVGTVLILGLLHLTMATWLWAIAIVCLFIGMGCVYYLGSE